MLRPAGSPRLFSLELPEAGAPPDQRLTLTSADAAGVTLERRPGQVVARWRGLGGRGVDVTGTVRTGPDDGLLHWRLAARPPDGLTLENARFPMLAPAPLQGTPDAWVAGARKGGVHTRPAM